MVEHRPSAQEPRLRIEGNKVTNQLPNSGHVRKRQHKNGPRGLPRDRQLKSSLLVEVGNGPDTGRVSHLTAVSQSGYQRSSPKRVS